eukprot:scaffold52077_cov52-Attheya_sp.AAC.3
MRLSASAMLAGVALSATRTLAFSVGPHPSAFATTTSTTTVVPRTHMALSMAKEIAKFNVGGHRYQVTRTLLEQHPDTMLARSASQVWQQDPESEIFMERNGIRFQYVLDYLRDGNVFLPVTESKEALIHDLNYFGINANDDMINDSDSKLYSTSSAMSAIRKEIVELDLEIAQLGLDSASKSLAVKCVQEFYKSSVTQTGTSFVIHLDNDTLHWNLLQSADGANMCNHHLERFGLEMRDACNYVIHVQELVKK